METAKKGWKSSEFWTVVAVAAVEFGNKVFGWHIDTATVQTMAAVVISYVLSRGIAKHGKTVVVEPQ